MKKLFVLTFFLGMGITFFGQTYVQGKFTTLKSGPWNNPSGDIWQDDAGQTLPADSSPDFADPGTNITINNAIHVGSYVTDSEFNANVIINSDGGAFQVQSNNPVPWTIKGDWTVSGNFTNYDSPHIPVINIESSNFEITSTGEMTNRGNLNHVSGNLTISGEMIVGTPN